MQINGEKMLLFAAQNMVQTHKTRWWLMTNEFIFDSNFFPILLFPCRRRRCNLGKHFRSQTHTCNTILLSLFLFAAVKVVLIANKSCWFRCEFRSKQNGKKVSYNKWQNCTVRSKKKCCAIENRLTAHVRKSGSANVSFGNRKINNHAMENRKTWLGGGKKKHLITHSDSCF